MKKVNIFVPKTHSKLYYRRDRDELDDDGGGGDRRDGRREDEDRDGDP